MSLDSKSIVQDKLDHFNFYSKHFPNSLFDYCCKNYNGLFNIAFQKSLNIVIFGVGSGCMELPLLIKLFNDFPGDEINLIAYDKSRIYINQFYRIIKLLSEGDISREVYKNSYDSKSCDTRKIIDTITIVLNTRKIKLNVHLEALDFEFDSEINDWIDFSDDFLGKSCKNLKIEKIHIAIFSFVLNHINYWRSLIAYVNSYLAKTGTFFVSQISGDNLIFNGDLLLWKVQNSERLKNKEDNINLLYDFFDKYYFKKFSILSDNHEISACNVTLLLQFFKNYNSTSNKYEVELDPMEYQISDFNKIIESDLYSMFTEYDKYTKKFPNRVTNREMLFKEYKDNDTTIKLKSKIIWHQLDKIESPELDHFNFIKSRKKQNESLNPGKLKNYIEESFILLQNQNSLVFDIDKHNLNFTNRDINDKVKSIISIIRRYNLFFNDVSTINLSLFNNNNVYRNIISNENIANYNERINNKSKANNYFISLEKGAKQGKIIKGYTNLDFFYDKLKTEFNYPFYLQYRLEKSDKNILSIQLKKEYNYYVIFFEFSSSFSQWEMMCDSDILNFKCSIDPLIDSICEITLNKKVFNSIILSLQITLEAYAPTTNIIILPIFRQSIESNEQIEKQNIGSCTIVSSNEKNIPNQVVFYNFIINEIVNLSRLNIISDYIKYQEVFKNHAIKSAKSAIMTRNMSHNLGSHVMFYLKNNLENVHSIIKSNVLKEIFDKTILNNIERAYIYTEEEKKSLFSKLDKLLLSVKNIEEINKIELPFLIGLGKFINYLKERQDFLATISTGDIPYSSPINFKDAVYDELNCDYKALRHNKTQSYRSGCKNFLLSYIAKSEKLSRDNIKIKFGEFNGLNNESRIVKHIHKDDDGFIYECSIDSSYSDESNYDLFESSEQSFNDYQRLQSLNVNFPGGIIGRQAFFSIIENYIRNSAKHYSQQITKLDINLNINEDIEEYPELIEIKLSNNLNNCGTNMKLSEEDINNGYNIPNDIKQYANILKLKKAIDESYINENGSLKDSNKGIKEMRICAAWLRGINNDNVKHTPPILSVNADDNNSIEYTFYLQKPQKVALLTDDERLSSKDELSSNAKILSLFRKFNWKVFDSSQLQNIPNTYRIVLIDSKLTGISETPNTHRFLFIDINKELFNNDFDLVDIDLDKLYLEYYKKIIIKNVFKKENLPIVYINDIDFDKQRKIDTSFVQNTNKWFSIWDERKSSYQDGDAQIIIFKNHLESTFDYDKFNKNFHEEFGYIESITGGNSTNRIIRNELINYEWYLKIIESAFTRIMVIDERLWNTFSEVDGKDALCIDKYNPDSLKNKSLRYRNIMICNIVKKYIRLIDKEFYEFVLINTEGDIIERISFNGYNNNFEGDGKSANQDLKNSFHFISTHQGLIDKLEDLCSKQFSKKYIAESYLKLIRKFLISSRGIDNNFIKDNTRLTVHSGKSRPSSEDLPDDTPYIPFSSIEYAINDCKLTLSETFYYGEAKNNIQ